MMDWNLQEFIPFLTLHTTASGSLLDLKLIIRGNMPLEPSSPLRAGTTKSTVMVRWLARICSIILWENRIVSILDMPYSIVLNLKREFMSMKTMYKEHFQFHFIMETEAGFI